MVETEAPEPEEAPKKQKKERQTSQRRQTSWGPFDDYEFVTTPYGEYGVPAGKVLERFEETKDRRGRTVYRPIYSGEFLTRTPEERAALRAERQAESQD